VGRGGCLSRARSSSAIIRGDCEDITGFCKSATLAEIEKHNFVLTPGWHVGIPDENEIPFEEKMGALTAELAAQRREAQVLAEDIKIQLAKVRFDLERLT
jgi:type I restriction enzyme M protein